MKKSIKFDFIILVFLLAFTNSFCQVTFEEEIKLSDKGLFFDGVDVGPNAGVSNNGLAYDFAFGSRITPHGDCIKEYNGYVFMTWYRGGKDDRHVMLSRYNSNTGVTKTIEFEHQHNGFQNVAHIGESHNTIAVGICPIDGTIHMLYDMHSYSENRPSDGSLANDYFRYSYSKKNAATVPDDQFALSQFVKDSDGDYKHLKMRNGTDYKSLTYPNFFLNQNGELLMWIREGGNTNGAYKFCKYDGNSWSDFTQFNVLNAKGSPGVSDNWGLYGDIKFSGGKMRIGFARRSNNKNDAYNLNNGFYYGYTDDPSGKTQWKDANNQAFSLPLYNSELLKVSEPTDYLSGSGSNSKYMSDGADWIVTDRGDIHAVTTVGSGSEKKSVHTYRKAGDSNFNTSISFPGGNLYTYQNEVYLIGLSGGRVFVEKADGGTNSWTKIYQATSGKRFRHGNVYISEKGKLYFYLMEQKTGSAQPIYLQILDLGLDEIVQNLAPTVSLVSPIDNAVYELGQEISLVATANDTDGSIAKVNFKINDAFYKQSANSPYEQVFSPTEAGVYKIAARAFDDENEQTEEFINITVVEPNISPTVEIISPKEGDFFYLGDEIPLQATASDVDGNIIKVNFKVNNSFYSLQNQAPYTNTFVPSQEGVYIIGARAFDNNGGETEVTLNIEVRVVTGQEEITGITEELNIFPNPSVDGIFHLSQAASWKVFSIDGQLMASGDSETIELPGFAKGMYLIQVRNQINKIILN